MDVQPARSKFLRNHLAKLKRLAEFYVLYNFIQQKSPTSVSGEMNAYYIGIPFSGGSNPG
ncbi:hypothetical protein J6TS1_26330 [Siminovitchia terrae]|uniref:Maturase K n=1 Tax=Siminovitchia terrae TaxID=1914933 RepID=A0ABQ4KXJ2_SIMTE|nr:hypothetical protein J6TS1_26330 [Siminovitchia terrae]